METKMKKTNKTHDKTNIKPKTMTFQILVEEKIKLRLMIRNYEILQSFLTCNNYVKVGDKVSEAVIIDQDILVNFYIEQIENKRYSVALWILEYIDDNNYDGLVLPNFGIYEDRTEIEYKLDIVNILLNKSNIMTLERSYLNTILNWSMEFMKYDNLIHKFKKELERRTQIKTVSDLLIDSESDYINKIIGTIANDTNVKI